ncbi:D-alanyl-D-alanine carboxypeptidase precursor [Flavobacterium anhuiense]|uniref:D-alanyl-D-alanine carboxypeptidase n=1 Tax=Flavobacterium anhuiense TaxID=459526 RepID=A0AAC9GJT7_9FLAO|nr:serine hydrolase [Flavobacterium anhuiense]AOC96990.1 D-alanyl-D-alanine carboxypeptidase precursor [Flavobacterium anhuiense]
MKKKYTLLLLLCSIMFVKAQTFQQKLQTAVTNSWSGSGLPGVSVAVSTPNLGMVYASAGIGNVYTQSPILSNTQYRIASATKNFTATLIMRLQDAGYFNINDKLSQHLAIPGLPNGSTITIKQLLQHTAGVGDYLNGSSAFINAAVPDKIFTDAEIVGYINNMGASFTPGSSYEYSNGGFYLLGMLIEKKLGKTLDVAIQEWITTPLELTNTFMDFTSTTTNKIPNLAEGTRAYNYSPTSVKGAGAIVANPGDLAKYCKAIFGGNYLTQSSINAMILPSALNSAYGLGTRLYTSSNNVKYHGHTGTILGYNSFMYYIPSLNVSVGITTNAYASPSSLWDNIKTAVYNVVEQEYLSYCATNNCFNANVPVPTAPTAGQVYVSTPVNFTWDSAVSNADYRIQVSKSNSGWNDTDGFTSATTPNSTVVVNDVVNTVKTYSWNTTSTAVAESPVGGTVYYYTIRSYSAATGTSKYSAPVSFTPKSAGCTLPGSTSITVDNLAATLAGAWTSTSATAGYIGTDYIHDGDTGKGTKSASFTPSIPQRGKYEVFINFTAGTNRPTNVPVDIIHENGTATVTVNQQINNGTWVSLGRYNFSAGSAGKAVIRTAGTTGVVIADAFKFTFIDCLPENTAPTASFTPTAAAVCEGQTVAYTSTSANATSYSWSFPGGTPSTSTAANPVVTYSTAGTYDASLTATNAIGSDTKTITGLVTVNPAATVVAGFTAPLTELAIGESITLTNTSTGATAYAWTFPNGSPSASTAANPSVSFTAAGSKTVTLVASNACGSNAYTMTFCVGSNTTTALETFEASAGRFTQAPTTSGSTVGIAAASTLARATDSFKNGTASLKAVLYDNTSVATDWLVRLLSGGGTPANNQAFVGNQGSFGFWMKTSTANAGATVTAWIDDTDGLEELPPQAIINNGAWNYYEWFLPTAAGTTITTGNGTVNGASVTLDAIVIRQGNTANTMTVWIDDIQHNYISGCSGTRKMLDIADDAAEVKTGDGLVAYPNPTDGILNLSLENNTKSDVRLYNASGQQLLNTTFEGAEQQLDLNGFGRGIYLLQVVADGKTITRKIILNK